MTTELTMPKLGEVMEEGLVLSWKKKVGDPVQQGEIILEIETDKAAADVESPVTGVLLKILVSENQKVPVNTPLAVIG